MASIARDIVQSGLKTVDDGLANVGLAAEAVRTAFSPVPAVTSDYDETHPDSYINWGITALRGQVKRGLPVTALPHKVVLAATDVLTANIKGLDDRKGLLEIALGGVSRLEPDSPAQEWLERAAINLLYRDVPHPPSTHMGDAYRFRQPDGSNNNPAIPDIGKSNTPYSRYITSTRPLPANELPDPGLVFDLLTRREKSEFEPHPAGLSGLFFVFATTLIHSLFRTSRTDYNINQTSSYADLSILYGNDKECQDQMRVQDGYGRLKPDCWAETRLLSLPPGVGALAVLFNRNHNYIADMILSINERGEWARNVDSLSKEKKLKQDYEIFNTARLINCVTYFTVFVHDYFPSIFGSAREGNSWSLDLTKEYRLGDHNILERGMGNSVSVEFNVLYRFHAAMSQQDAQYTEDVFEALFGPNADFDEITPEIFELKVAGLSQGKQLKPEDLKKLSEEERIKLKDDSKPLDYFALRWGRNVRDPVTGKYPDDVIAGALQKATSVPAGAFRARGTPAVMRVVEIIGLEQARTWGVGSLNDFRRYFGLKPYTSFEEWNPKNKDVADAARKLYRDIENLELYVGIQAEEVKGVGEMVGLCAGYTMSRGIVADACATVRGDRHFTYDLNPENLTTWGYTDATVDKTNAAWGGMLGKILKRNLPQHYAANSTYTNFPLITPTGQPYSMDKILKKVGQLEDYDISEPVKQPDTKVISKAAEFSQVLLDGSSSSPWSTKYEHTVKAVKFNPTFLNALSNPAQYSKALDLMKSLLAPANQRKATVSWYESTTAALLKSKRLDMEIPRKGSKSVVHAVDVVKDVFRLVPTHWAAFKAAGLPMKSKEHPHGIYYEQQVWQMLKEIHTYLFYEVDSSRDIPLKNEAASNITRLARLVKLSLVEGKFPYSFLTAIPNLLLNGHNTENEVRAAALGLNSPVDETSKDLLAGVAMVVPELAQIFTHVLDFCLAPEKPSALASDEEHAEFKRRDERQNRIVALAQSPPSIETDDTLKGYIREALRLDPVVEGVYRQAKTDRTVGEVSVRRTEYAFFDFRAAGQSADIFTNPVDVNPGRPATAYKILEGDTAFKVLGAEYVYDVTLAVIRTVMRLRGIRRAKGNLGTLRRFKETLIRTPASFSKKDDAYAYTPAEKEDHVWRWAYLDTEDKFRVSRWANGLTLNYDP